MDEMDKTKYSTDYLIVYISNYTCDEQVLVAMNGSGMVTAEQSPDLLVRISNK